MLGSMSSSDSTNRSIRRKQTIEKIRAIISIRFIRTDFIFKDFLKSFDFKQDNETERRKCLLKTALIRMVPQSTSAQHSCFISLIL